MTASRQPPSFSAGDIACMRRAIELARRGEGLVEPNPMVGAVVADASGRVLGEGWHEAFGGPHAEVNALAAAGSAARAATLYVTLEPCCHHGKTPPCTEAILAAGISRVVVAAGDPHPSVAGGGITALRQAGLQVDCGLLEAEAVRLTAPFRKLMTTGTPWVIAKWAMTLDGCLALPPAATEQSVPDTAAGHRWISSPASRQLVHDLRRRIDAILVGIGTALADDPLLTARPPGGRPLLRVALDRTAKLPLASRLVQTAGQSPLLIAVGPQAPSEQIGALEAAGGEVWQSQTADPAAMLQGLLQELGRRRLTNLLVEGGPGVLQTCFAAAMIDEAWVFIAPRLSGGQPQSLPRLPTSLPELTIESVRQVGDDILVCGRPRSAPPLTTCQTAAADRD